MYSGVNQNESMWFTRQTKGCWWVVLVVCKGLSSKDLFDLESLEFFPVAVNGTAYIISAIKQTREVLSRRKQKYQPVFTYAATEKQVYQKYPYTVATV